MTALQFPCTIFRTQKRMDDYFADDMRCGDLSESQLKSRFHLVDISSKADPYRLRKINTFSQPQSPFYGTRKQGEQITRQQCASILFDEFRSLSRSFALYGPYKLLIEKMITHMQKCNGAPFSHGLLNTALKENIINDKSENSSLKRIKDILTSCINREKKIFPLENKDDFYKNILSGRLPKFNRFQDNFNGMGITVHDTWATCIQIKSLIINSNSYEALLYYRIQDHFGLDDDDICKYKFNQLRFFRIWFVLQRYNQFGFKPFMTNMEVNIKLTGDFSEKK